MSDNDGAASLVRSDALLALADEWDKRSEKLVNANVRAVWRGLKKGVMPSESHGVGEACGLGRAVQDLRRIVKKANEKAHLRVRRKDRMTTPKATAAHPLGEASGSRFDADDRGNVVDFYSLPDNEQVARLDREAEVNGVRDQLAFDNWAGGAELETWMRNNGYGDELDRAARL
jgi:hypothetical protein